MPPLPAHLSPCPSLPPARRALPRRLRPKVRRGSTPSPPPPSPPCSSPGKDHQIVTLRGKFTEHVRGDKYVFTDDKGASIRAELDHDRDWSMITKDAPVEIRAEVDKDWTEIELDVLSAKPL